MTREDAPVSITARCPNPECGAKLKARDAEAGHIRTCPRCKGKVPVPRNASQNRQPVAVPTPSPAVVEANTAHATPKPASPLAAIPPLVVPVAEGMKPPDSWYIARNKTKCGPYTADQLQQLARAGQLSPDDMLLQEGNPKWQAAKM